MNYDPNKSRVENLLSLAIEMGKSSLLLWILIPIFYFLWRIAF